MFLLLFKSCAARVRFVPPSTMRRLDYRIIIIIIKTVKKYCMPAVK